MRRLLIFLFKYRALFTFVAVEILCAFLIIQNNTYQSAAFFNSSNQAIAGILSSSNQVASYFELRKTNQQLSEEIAQLRMQLEEREKLISTIRLSPYPDTIDTKVYRFIPAKVVSNSTGRRKNYLTINRGTEDQVAPGQGVIGGGGIVGKVKYSGKRYSVVTSLLHTDLLISVKINGKVNLGSVQWNGLDPRYVDLLYIPRHIQLMVGDTVRSSGFNGIFPDNIMIGIVDEASISEGAFFDARVKLINDFSNLAYVHVIENLGMVAKDSVESLIEINE